MDEGKGSHLLMTLSIWAQSRRIVTALARKRVAACGVVRREETEGRGTLFTKNAPRSRGMRRAAMVARDRSAVAASKVRQFIMRGGPCVKQTPSGHRMHTVREGAVSRRQRKERDLLASGLRK